MEGDNVLEKSEIEQALVRLERMYTKWGLKPKNWVVVDEIAYMLQGRPIFCSNTVCLWQTGVCLKK